MPILNEVRVDNVTGEEIACSDAFRVNVCERVGSMWEKGQEGEGAGLGWIGFMSVEHEIGMFHVEHTCFCSG
jgi:hypothetical protein